MSTYCARSDIEAVYGVTNVSTWADLDNDADATKITNRIADAITDASAYIDDRFRETQYAVPFTTVPRQILRLTAKLSGLYLYENRGAQDVNQETGQLLHRYKGVGKTVDEQINAYLAGMMKLDLTPTLNTTSAPEIVA